MDFTLKRPKNATSEVGVIAATTKLSSNARPESRDDSPYARFRLFRNPFGELTRAERCSLAVIDRAACLSMLRDTRSALQVLGPCGHGKTTHLLALQRAMKQSHAALSSDRPARDADARSVPASTTTHYLDNYVYFPEEGTQPSLPIVRPLFVDEAQRLSWKRRRELLAGDGPLILGTHVDLGGPLRKAGFTVHTLDVSRPLGPERLQRILNRRILASRTGAAGSLTSELDDMDGGNGQSSAAAYHPLCLTLAQTVALQRQFGSDIRRIEHYLYDAFQRFAEKGGPWLPVS